MSRVFALADLHGSLDLYKEVKEFLQPDDMVYYLGDAGDRGPEPWKTIVEIYNDPQFIYIKGNHEDMLVKAMNEWIPEHLHGHDFSLLCSNGGRKTFQEWKEGPERNKWRTKIASLPLQKTHLNIEGKIIYLTHAGVTPSGPVLDNFELSTVLWNREHIYEAWTEDLDNIIMVHGHTPFPYLNEAYDIEDPITEYDIIHNNKKLHAIWYCEHHKCCIDMGAVFLGQTVLLDLDTWEEHLFGKLKEI